MNSQPSLQIPQFNVKAGGSFTFFTLLFIMLGLCVVLMFYLFYFSAQSTTISSKDKIISWAILLGLCSASALFYLYFARATSVQLDTSKIVLFRGKRPIRIFEKEKISYIAFVQSEGVLRPGYPQVKLSKLDFTEALKAQNESNALTTNSIIVSTQALANGALPDFFTLSNDNSFILFHRDTAAAQWIANYFKEKII